MTLVDVIWDGLALNADAPGEDTLTCVVTNVTGSYSTPGVETNDVARTLTDGVLYGPKVTGGREITIEGVVIGPRDKLIARRNDLAVRTIDTRPADLVIGDPWLDLRLSATVRASAEMEHEFKGPFAFAYQIVLTASDARRYGEDWRSATIAFGTGEATGRTYPRTYSWHYASTTVPGSAQLTNLGGLPAPVYAIYTGPLSETWLTNGTRTIHVGPLAAGEQIMIATDTLIAQASGGATRASYVLPGSVPLTVPAKSTVTWNLLGTGTGSVQLLWRSTYA